VSVSQGVSCINVQGKSEILASLRMLSLIPIDCSQVVVCRGIRSISLNSPQKILGGLETRRFILGQGSADGSQNHRISRPQCESRLKVAQRFGFNSHATRPALLKLLTQNPTQLVVDPEIVRMTVQRGSKQSFSVDAGRLQDFRQERCQG